MRRKRVAIACQGGGAQTAFTAGALDAILGDLRLEGSQPEAGGFDIVALSGTSGGALCAALAWFELMLDKDAGEPPQRFRRFWSGGYPDGIAAVTPPEAMIADWLAFLQRGELPWRRQFDSLRAELGDWALHQDFPGPALPFQLTARLRPYYYHQFFAALDAQPGAYGLRAGLEAMRGAIAAAASAAPWPGAAQIGRMLDDAFELNPLLPGSEVRRELDPLESFRALIEHCFEADRAALELRRAGATDPTPIELLVGAADVGGAVRLDQSAAGGDFDNLTNWKVFRGSERLEQLTDVLLASAAIPELMRAAEVDGEQYWDGVFSQNPPILDLPDVHGESIVDQPTPPNPEEIWLILINPLTRAEAPRDLADIDDRKNELSGNIALAQEVRAIAKMNNVVATVPERDCKRRYEPITFRAIQMTNATKRRLSLPSKLDRRRANIDPLFEEGRVQAQLFLQGWRRETAADDDAPAATAAE